MELPWPSLIPCAALATLAPVLVRMHRGIRGTVLHSAWRWALLVWMAGLTLWGATVADLPGQKWADRLWYAFALLALTPPIAVLGARRPTVRVWTWFVLIPLLLVFAWPLVPSVWDVRGAGPFDLEEPVLFGYCLVLVMGAGNYLGLRHTLAALLWMGGFLLIVLPLCPATGEWVPSAPTGRLWGTLCVVAAVWIADRQAVRRRPAPSDASRFLDRVWSDFRDLFGIVWARRIQERFNDDARQKDLPLRLTMHGFERTAETARGTQPDPQSLVSAEASLRWLLQKFVDPDWIDRRLAP